MELLQGIETRHSVRGFLPTPIPEPTLRRVLEAASRSPSYTNTQPWEVAVVAGRKRDELSTILDGLVRAGTLGHADLPVPKQWPAALAERAARHHAARFAALGVERDDAAARSDLRARNFRFFNSPCVLLLFMDASLGPWSTLDMGMFAQSLALAAHAVGLGTCLQASVAGYPDAIRTFLGLTDSKKLMLAISIGYPDPDAALNHYCSARKGLEEFVTWYA
jgi:nitroreductase